MQVGLSFRRTVSAGARSGHVGPDVDALLADDAAMFGARGRAAVMALKRENLSRAPSYRIESVAAVDVRGGSVAAVFECLIPGREGRGVDVVRVADGKVVAVDALRF